MRSSAGVWVAVAASSAILLLAAGGSSAAPGGRWVVRDLGVPVSLFSGDGGLYLGEEDAAINERGQVAVTRVTNLYGHSRAFLWERGRFRDLGVLPGDTDSRVIAINDRGQIVGVSWAGESDSRGHAFLWENGRMRNLGGLSRGGAAAPVGVNMRGEVAGNVPNTPFEPLLSRSRAVVWKPGRVHALGILRGGDRSESADINDRGQVVGASTTATNTDGVAFLWQNGRMRGLGTVPGYEGSYAVDINERGQVVGGLIGRGGAIEAGVFIWQNGKMSEIRKPQRNWGLWLPVAINDRGQVALTYGRAWVLWQNGKSLYAGPGEPTALNERGQVTITGGYEDEMPRIWMNGNVIRLPILPGDEGGSAIALNERNQVVGISGRSHWVEGAHDYTWVCHYVLWTWTGN